MYSAHKLSEAQFFWAKALEANRASNEQAFYFSAFLSAFRSTTFVIQSEYSSRPGFGEVYERLREYLRVSEVFSEIVKARNTALKEGSRTPKLVTRITAHPSGDVLYSELDSLPLDSRPVGKIQFNWGSERGPAYPINTSNDHRLQLTFGALMASLPQFLESSNKTIEHFVKLTENGQLYEIAALNSRVQDGLARIRQTINEIETSMAPSLRKAQ